MHARMPRNVSIPYIYTPKLFKQKQNHLKRAQKTNFTHTHTHNTNRHTHRNIHFNNTQRPTICSQP